MNRREFLFVSSGAAVGSLLVSGLADAAERDGRAAVAAGSELGSEPSSGLVTSVPKPLRHAAIPGFLSADQLAPHHAAHYGGALAAFVDVEAQLDASFRNGTKIDAHAYAEIKRLQSSRGNSVLLHELYFDGLRPRPLESQRPPAISEDLRSAIERRFGSIDRWAIDFVASAKLAAGWAMLVIHPVNGRLYNVVSDEHADGPLWTSAPLVVIDTYEHAFYIDYRNRKSEYVETFIDHIDWEQADRRLRLAA